MNAILLATYNGAEFLAAFLESLQRQTVTDWRLLIRDDGSTDATCKILRRAASCDARISIVEDDGRRRGVTGNFGALLERAYAAGARYAFLADQDDVWMPDKLLVQLDLMHRVEAASAPGTPILVHSDLTVVDRRLQTLHPSHSQCMGLHRDRAADDPLRILLASNFVTGCTCLLNRPLLQAALPIPSCAVIHDWWIALCAAAMGQIRYLPDPTVLYRQHGSNVVGAQSLIRILMNPFGARWLRRCQRSVESFRRAAFQVTEVRRRMVAWTPTSTDRLTFVDSYARILLSDRKALNRIYRARRLRIGRSGVFPQLLLAAKLALPLPEFDASTVQNASARPAA